MELLLIALWTVLFAAFDLSSASALKRGGKDERAYKQLGQIAQRSSERNTVGVLCMYRLIYIIPWEFSSHFELSSLRLLVTCPVHQPWIFPPYSDTFRPIHPRAIRPSWLPGSWRNVYEYYIDVKIDWKYYSEIFDKKLERCKCNASRNSTSPKGSSWSGPTCEEFPHPIFDTKISTAPVHPGGFHYLLIIKKSPPVLLSARAPSFTTPTSVERRASVELHQN